MADEDWAKVLRAKPKTPADKWDGEDEEEDVKDNWDDEEEEEQAPGPAMVATAAPKNKNKTKSKIAEKERIELEKGLHKITTKTPEEIAAEKLRLEKAKEAAEIRGIQEAFGSTEINVADPQTKDDFDEIRKRLVSDLARFETRLPFGDFMEDLIQDLCLYLPSQRLKKVKTSVEALYFEKSKTEKAAAKSTSGKGAVKHKIKLNVEGDRAMLNNYGEEVDEFEDFM